MSDELSPVQQKFVESQVAKGAFASTDKVVDAALQLLSERELE
ncbi:ribbon-helix-helix domain-containing protein [Blastopirellula retiformator]|nr:type II toxin-antitoxin system ParD family antitoxin [Blastopirellula retiformator]